MAAPGHVYLIDASGFIFRAFHALPPMNRPDGTPVNAVRGFCAMIMKVISGTDADHIACVFDYSSKSFRNDIYDQYKAHRPETPEDLVPQFPLIREAARAFNLPVVEKEGYEADDIIATYARMASEAGARTTIVSSDKDLMQLVSDSVGMLDGVRTRDIGEAEVIEKFGVVPDKVVEVQALAGDSVDNVPGVPGIGVKTAAQLIGEYGDLETLLQRAHEIRQPKRRQRLMEHAGDARMSLRLVTLDRHVPLDEGLEALARQEPEAGVLLEFLHAQDFRTLASRAETWLQERADDALPDHAGEAYELVQDVAALERWVAGAVKAGVVAVDTETTGLDAMAAELVGISMSTSPGNGCYIPLAHRSAEPLVEAPRQIPLDEARVVLAPMLADPAVLKVGHNIKYDSHILSRAGMPVSPVDDTMLVSYCLEGGKQRHHTIDALASVHLDRKVISFKEVAGSGRSQVTFDLVPLDRALDYAAEDADVALALWHQLKPRLARERVTRVYETIERPLIPVIAAMESAGVKVDRAELELMSSEFGFRIRELEGEIHELAGRPFTIGSPKQLGEILFGEMGLEGGRKSRQGAWSTSADVLENLAGQGHVLPARVLDWRKLSKLKSTYTDTLVSQINPRTGRVHTSFSMAAAPTGRLASTDPNLQNIPIRTEEGRRIRTAFIAEPGHLLLSADYSQIELRLLAHIARIESLKEAFHQGIDIHAMTASQVFSVPLEEMDPLTRRNAKAINFGIIYGISAFGLARQLAIGRDEAKAYIDAYFERYPGIRDYMERTIESARQQGHVTTLFGRKCHVPDIRNANPALRAYNERAAINAPLQGSAADIIKRAMIRVPDALRTAGLAGRMLLQVHDELLFEVPEGEAEATAGCVRKVMEEAASLSVPLTVDVGVAANWSAAH